MISTNLYKLSKYVLVCCLNVYMKKFLPLRKVNNKWKCL